MSSFSGIKNTLLAEQVEEQLYEYITKLPLKAGDKLPNEFKLAEMFGVGRSTVREAVKLLVSRNVLETRRKVPAGHPPGFRPHRHRRQHRHPEGQPCPGGRGHQTHRLP
mgnify:CR=1 FL=1